MTDSELVPWGKGEKNPDKGSEIDTEIECLQAVRADLSVMAYLLYEHVTVAKVCDELWLGVKD